MTPEQFQDWRTGLGLSRLAAAKTLGLSRNMPRLYETGERDVPKYVALAMTAVYRRLEPWPDD